MSLPTLPTEVLAHIIGYLDTKTVYDLYESCKYLRNIICMSGVVKECQFSLNTLATVKSLKTDLFRDLSGHLTVLNLCGVHDLGRLSLISALKKLNNLIDLDVTYTKIIIPDCIEITKVRPTLQSLSVNFMFSLSGVFQISEARFYDYQQAFKNLKNVYFVGSLLNLLYGTTAVCMLQHADLFNLKFTFNGDIEYVDNYDEDWENAKMPTMSQFQMHFVNFLRVGIVTERSIFRLLDLKKYEILTFQTYTQLEICATPLLKKFICENYSISVYSVDEDDEVPIIMGEAAIMLWDKQSTKFNADFYSKLLVILKKYLIFHIEAPNVVAVPPIYDRCSIENLSEEFERGNLSGEGNKSKRARVDKQKLNLNYDDAFTDIDNIKLNIKYIGTIKAIITLNNWPFLKKLSHLTLKGNIQFSSEAFKNLFKFCDSLITLRLEGHFPSPTVLQSISKSNSLQNLYINVSGIDFSHLFKCFSKCKTLENIHIVNINKNNSVNTLPNPRHLFNNCKCLYNICIRSDMRSYRDKDKMLRQYKKVRHDLGRDCLNIDIFCGPVSRQERYSPYVGVFDVFPLKPL